MWIKFELTGELEKQFMDICESECRTQKQQAFWVLKKYINEYNLELLGTNENQSEQIRTDKNETELFGTNWNNSELDRTNQNNLDKSVPMEQLDKNILNNVLTF